MSCYHMLLPSFVIYEVIRTSIWQLHAVFKEEPKQRRDIFPIAIREP